MRKSISRLEDLLDSDLEVVTGGQKDNHYQGTCVCTSGAGETIYVEPSLPIEDPNDPIKQRI